jgi:manganese/zinc/iron transport system ATP- binding protein
MQTWRPDNAARLETADSRRSVPSAGDSPALGGRIRDLTVAYHRRPVLWEINVDLPMGAIIGLVGPNGAGKSSLLKAMLGLVPLVSGTIELLGASLAQRRQSIAYVPQREQIDWDFPATVMDVVLMGTYGQLGWIRPVSRPQRQMAQRALAQLQLEGLADARIGQLSGGQQQRTFLARALVQQPRLLLLDEPLAAVDAATEQAIIDLLRRLRDSGCCVVVVHHDLHTAASYFDQLVLLNMRCVAAGPTAQVFTPENLRRTYGGRLTLLEEVVESMRHGGSPP